MKKFILFLVVIAVFAFAGTQLATVTNIQLPKQVRKTLPVDPPITPTPIIAQPAHLTIPKLNLNAPIDPVGLDKNGRMDVPTTVGATGWYSMGSKPGEIGNAVIDGHFDTPTGAPSVFYYIGNLAPGDTIQVTTTDNKVYTFSVTQVTSFPDNGFPIEQVFGKSDTKNLNLITCSGTWDRAAHNYSNRTVVFSTLTK